MEHLSKQEFVALEILKTLIPHQKDFPSLTPTDLTDLACNMAKQLIKESN